MNVEMLEREILILEKSLLSSDVRSSPEKIAELIANDFFEYCSSGTVYFYHENDSFGAGEQTNYSQIKDFSIRVQSENVILATYKLIRPEETNPSRKHSLRSSIWKKIDGSWKMAFHQGTPCDL